MPRRPTDPFFRSGGDPLIREAEQVRDARPQPDDKKQADGPAAAK